MKNKKGSHVGVVVSFVVFVTFLVFLYLIIQPATIQARDKQYILDYLKLNLAEDSTIEITSVTIEVEDTGSKNCVNLQNIDEAIIPSELFGNLVFKNSSGDVLVYEIQGQGIEVGTGTNYAGIITVYYSPDIIGEQGSLGGCNPHSDPQGVIKTYTEITEEKLNALSNLYTFDYEGLKAMFGIPDDTDFNFYILNSEREVVISAKNSEIPSNTNVFVEETPLQYMNGDGNVVFGFLKLEVW